MLSFRCLALACVICPLLKSKTSSLKQQVFIKYTNQWISPSFDLLNVTCMSPDPFCPFLMIILYINFYEIKKRKFTCKYLLHNTYGTWAVWEWLDCFDTMTRLFYWLQRCHWWMKANFSATHILKSLREKKYKLQSLTNEIHIKKNTCTTCGFGSHFINNIPGLRSCWVFLHKLSPSQVRQHLMMFWWLTQQCIS